MTMDELELRQGAFKRQVGVPKRRKVPLALENKIISAPEGKTVKNPTKTGDKHIKVTKLMKKRAVFAKNARSWEKKKSKKSSKR